MKASELITRVQKLIDENGDLDIYLSDSEVGKAYATDVYICTDKYPPEGHQNCIEIE